MVKLAGAVLVVIYISIVMQLKLKRGKVDWELAVDYYNNEQI